MINRTERLNMKEQYQRSALLLGEEAIDSLFNKRVCVFGLGGVGGSAMEALARAGIGHFDLIDNDTVNVTNINRQILATHKDVGRKKVDVAEERIHAINPEIEVRKFDIFYLPETRGLLSFEDYDYIVDAIDTVTAKIDIIVRAKESGIRIISAMGCGNRLNPSLLTAMDLFDTKGDPLSKVMRRELRKRGVTSLKVVCSKEEPTRPQNREKYFSEEVLKRRKDIPGSTSFVPPAAGLLLAYTVIMDLLEQK